MIYIYTSFFYLWMFSVEILMRRKVIKSFRKTAISKSHWVKNKYINTFIQKRPWNRRVMTSQYWNGCGESKWSVLSVGEQIFTCHIFLGTASHLCCMESAILVLARTSRGGERRLMPTSNDGVRFTYKSSLRRQWNNTACSEEVLLLLTNARVSRKLPKSTPSSIAL